MSENNYKTTIVESSRELTVKEKIQAKKTATAKLLVEEVPETGDGLILDLDYFVILHIENSKSDDKEYDNLLLVTKEGERYITGSSSFINELKSIYEEVSQEADLDWSLRVVNLPSKNYKGKYFLSCDII